MEIVFFSAILPSYRSIENNKYSILGPGPMQAEPVNLVRRGTEQP
jgi:hypothetical protein